MAGPGWYRLGWFIIVPAESLGHDAGVPSMDATGVVRARVAEPGQRRSA